MDFTGLEGIGREQMVKGSNDREVLKQTQQAVVDLNRPWNSLEITESPSFAVIWSIVSLA